MSSMFLRIFSIARNTFREAIRNRVLAILVFFAVALIAFSTVLGALSLHEDIRIIKDLGLSGIDLFGVVISLFLGVNLLAKELERKTVYSMLSKPIRRSEFLLGKYLGLVMTMTLLVAVMSAVLALVLWLKGGSHDVLLFRAECLVWFELITLVAVAMFFSAFSTPYLSAMMSAALWLIGRNMAELTAFVQAKVEVPWMKTGLMGALSILPDFRLFYISGGTLDETIVSIHDQFVSWSYVGWTGLYALGYASVCLLFAMELFRRRDFI